MRGARNFPFRKKTSDLDIELQDGTGDADIFPPSALLRITGASGARGVRVLRRRRSEYFSSLREVSVTPYVTFLAIELRNRAFCFSSIKNS